MLAKPTPVRLSEHADTRLAEIAKANGMTKAELIRVCVEKFLQEIEETGKIEISQVVRIDKKTKNERRTA